METGSSDPVEASVSIPAGALSGDQEITIAASDSSDLPDPPPGQTLLSRAFNFGPDGLTFALPVTLTFTYTDAEVAGLDESALTVALLVDGGLQTVPDCADASVPTPSPCVSGRSPAANTITVVTDHFSTYAIAAPVDVSGVIPLNITTAAVTVSGVTLDGTDQTVNGSTSAWRADAVGESGGWNVTVSSTDFTNAESNTIAVSNFEIRLLVANIVRISGSFDLPTSTQTSFDSLSGTARKIASAASGKGDGVYDLTPGFQLTVPAETYTGSYTATVTVAISAGP